MLLRTSVFSHNDNGSYVRGVFANSRWLILKVVLDFSFLNLFTFGENSLAFGPENSEIVGS